MASHLPGTPSSLGKGGTWDHSGSIECLLLAQESHLTVLKGVYGVLRIKVGLAICKANALLLYYYLWPFRDHFSNIYFKILFTYFGILETTLRY